jgi:hypothetical protein
MLANLRGFHAHAGICPHWVCPPPASAEKTAGSKGMLGYIHIAP